MQRPQFLLHKRHLSEFPFKVDLLSNSMQLTLISYEYTYVHPLSLRSFYATPPGPVPGSLRKHPFLLALRRDEERGETDVFAGYLEPGRAVLHKTTVATKGVRTCTRNLLK